MEEVLSNMNAKENDECNTGETIVVIRENETISINTGEDQEIKDAQINNEEKGVTTEEHRRRASTNSNILVKCRVCDSLTAKRMKDTLTCHVCKGLVHYSCTKLPIYMLFSLSKGTKKYSCEECSAPSEEFTQRFGQGYEKPAESREINNATKMAEVERRLTELSVIVEKFDLQKITDNLKDSFEKIEKTNHSINENLAHLKKERKENMICKHACSSNEDNGQVKEIEELKEELRSYKKSYEILMESIGEKDKQVNTLNESKSKCLTNLKQKDETIRELNKQITRYKAEIGEVNDEKGENKDLREKIASLKSEYDEKLSEVTEKCISNATNVDGKQDIINLLTTQLREANESKKKLEDNLNTIIRANNNRADVNSANREPVVEKSDEEAGEDEPIVILLHDSLCKNINETIMSKEKVNFKKIWAPTLAQMSDEIDKLNENVDTIVVQALTRDLSEYKIMEIGSKLNTVIENACSKAKSVVVSTIAARHDDERIKMMAEVVNANIKYAYMNNPKVTVCDNENLRDKELRVKDGIHLTDDGTSRLASNIKFAVAKALNIKVERKYREKTVRYNNDGNGRRNYYKKGGSRYYNTYNRGYTERRNFDRFDE